GQVIVPSVVARKRGARQAHALGRTDVLVGEHGRPAGEREIVAGNRCYRARDHFGGAVAVVHLVLRRERPGDAELRDLTGGDGRERHVVVVTVVPVVDGSCRGQRLARPELLVVEGL